MIKVVMSSEYTLKKRKIDELIKESNISNKIFVDFEESSLMDIINEANYCDLFNETKLIVVSSFSFSSLKKEEEEVFYKFLESDNSNYIILNTLDKSLDNRKKLTQKIKSLNALIEIPSIEKKTMYDFFIDYIKSNGYSINSELVKKIVRDGSFNSEFIFNEIDKLLLYKSKSKKILEEDVLEVISKNNERELYEFTDAVIEKNRDKIYSKYKILMELDIEPSIILASIIKQFNTLFMIKLMSESMEIRSISNKLFLNEYIVGEIIRKSRNYSYEILSDLFDELLKTDSKLKNNNDNGYRIIGNYLLTI